MTRDGTKIAIASNDRNGRDTDLLSANPRAAGSHADSCSRADGEFWEAQDWSGDASKLLISRYVSINESYPAILDVADGRETDDSQSPDSRRMRSDRCGSSADSKSIYLSTRRARRVLATGAARRRNAAIHVAHRRTSPGTSRRSPSTRIPAAWPLRSTRTARAPCTCWKTTGPRGWRSSPASSRGLEFSPDGSRLGFTLARPEAPSDVYSLTLADRQLDPLDLQRSRVG